MKIMDNSSKNVELLSSLGDRQRNTENLPSQEMYPSISMMKQSFITG